MFVNFNKKLILAGLIFFSTATSVMLCMEPQRETEASQPEVTQPNTINQNRIIEQILVKGFAHYLTQKFGYDDAIKNTLFTNIYAILEHLNKDHRTLKDLCFHAYLYFRKYIAMMPQVLAKVTQPSDLLYLVLLMAHLAQKNLYDNPHAAGDLARIFKLSPKLFHQNTLRIISTLNFRLSIEVLEQTMHNPPAIDPDPCGKFITNRVNPYGDIPGHYAQLISWGSPNNQ